ncbi:DinB family protein [Desulfovibrio sp. X2]|uniref:DinB family protein n=1 Tax=Desulfovibrio sp. X2 TaxID=941449 RepID=UPI00035887F1|nr:DinB family protein [Desulfovibrio sp. X2]EPR39867.1 DinB family protein [Desulfovibrio sp. X2]
MPPETPRIPSPSLIDVFRIQAEAGRFADRRLAQALLRLPPGEYARPRASWYGSLQGVLCHVLWADRIWLARFQGTPLPKLDQRGDPDECPDAAAWAAAREACDQAVVDWTQSLAPVDLSREITCRTTSGEAWLHPLWQAACHLFNHQAHHRGQVDAMLAQSGIPDLLTDMMLYQREAGLARKG